MAKFYNQLDSKLADFIAGQKMFFVATAPKSGRINLSPKGMDTFRVLDMNRCCYLDLTGSGNETAAHLLNDGRVTVMFNSFTRNPLILRLYGRGRMVVRSTAEWDELYRLFDGHPGARQICVIDIESVQTSCGYAVPVTESLDERDTLTRWTEAKGEDIDAYRTEKNLVSIDGLPTGLGTGQ
jgi:hypothetical protein